MNNFKKSNGITLVALVVTILILIILAGVTLYQILNRDSIEYARYGAFVTNFRMMEENIIIYRASKEMENIGSKNLTTIEKLPLKDKVTMQEIKKKSSLEKKIKEMTGKPIKEVNLYWVDNNKVDGKIKIKCVYDIDNNQLYDYEGEKIFGKIWHTPNSGTVEGNAEENGEETMWDGWITMNLYYPANSTERKWRLSSEGEIRYDESTQWKDYTGPITVKLSDVDNIWIKYKIDGKEYIISSNGQVVVDITADSYYPNLVEKVKVQISYDFNSIEDTRVYRIGNGDWLKYDGEFYVTENELIEAKCMKIENTYDNDGNLIYTIDRWGSDSFYIRNIKQTSISENHEAPTLTRNAPINENEVANVTISDYPSDAKKVVYKINYGIEQEYDGNNITIQKYGTSIIAYYYDTTGKKSKMREIIINDTTPEGSNENAGTMFNPTSPGKTPIEGGNGSSGDGSGTGSSSGGSSGGGSNNVVVTSKVIIPKPIINCTPTAKTTTGVTIGITIPDNYTAREIYVKIGNNPYMKYNEDINMTYNTTIKA